MSKGKSTLMTLGAINAILAMNGAKFDYDEFRRMDKQGANPIYIPKRKKKKG